jgi:exopolyphosphatase/guanosine-5'-triphosphate,3'-diphosphate pyrophosphatase
MQVFDQPNLINQPVAVMDLGTNVFHLLIAEKNGDGFKELLHLQEAVKLGEGGINKGIIQPAAFERGLETMQRFRSAIAQYQVPQVKAVATSALRNAGNGQEFIDSVNRLTGIAISLIDGDEEAAYIYKGIKASGCLDEETALIVDIGGGSVEFILCNKERIFWKQSFEVGAARLMDLFHRTDPISAAALIDLQQYLDERLNDLFSAVKAYPIRKLIGSAGAFETFAVLGERQAGKENVPASPVVIYAFEQSRLMTVLGGLIRSTHAERQATGLIPPVRVDMIVVSAVLTEYLVTRLKIGRVQLSYYSLKEGLLADLLGV